MVRTRLRIRFRKQGDLRLIGHHDLRARLGAAIAPRWPQAAHERGLSPAAEVELSVGLVDRPVGPRRGSGTGARRRVFRRPGGSRHGAAFAAGAESSTRWRPCPHTANRPRWSGWPSSSTCLRHGRPTRPSASSNGWRRARTWCTGPDGRPLDWRPLVEELRLADGRLRMAMRVTRQGSIRPRDLLAVLELEDLEQQDCYLTRTAVELEA